MTPIIADSEGEEPLNVCSPHIILYQPIREPPRRKCATNFIETFSKIEFFQESMLSWDTVFKKTAHENFSHGKKNVRCKMGDLREKLSIHRAGKGRGRCLTLCYEALLGIPPTSVQPERDFSIENIIPRRYFFVGKSFPFQSYGETPKPRSRIGLVGPIIPRAEMGNQFNFVNR